MLLRADLCRAGPQKGPRRNERSSLKSVAALVADTTCWTTPMVTALQYRRGLKTSSSGPMLSRFRTMLFPLGQSSNSDVDVGFPRGQHFGVKHFPGPQRPGLILAVARVWRTFTVKAVLWLGFGVELRSRRRRVAP